MEFQYDSTPCQVDKNLDFVDINNCKLRTVYLFTTIVIRMHYLCGSGFEHLEGFKVVYSLYFFWKYSTVILFFITWIS